MTLRTRLISVSCVLIAFLTLITLACVLSLQTMSHAADTMAEEYQEVALLESARLDLLDARLSLSGGTTAEILTVELNRIAATLDKLEAMQDDQSGADTDHHRREGRLASEASSILRGVVERLGTDPPSPDAIGPEIEHAGDLVHELSSEAGDAVEASIKEAQETLTRGASVIIIASVAAALAAILAGFVQYRTLVRAATRMRDRADQVLRPNARRSDGRDALSGLTEDFDTVVRELEGMYEQIEERVRTTSRDLVQAERLASVGFLAAGVAHEINNPLASILGYTELCLRRTDGGEATDVAPTLAIVREEALRCRGIVEQLLTLARKAPAEEHHTINLAAVVESAVASVEGLRIGRERRITVESNGQAHTIGVEPELRQVVLNLLINAIEATASDGRIRIEVSRDGPSSIVRVADDGVGMTAAELGDVFEPFYSRKSGRNVGVGLGLSIAHAIVRHHGGALTVVSPGPGEGSEFTMTLPAAEAP